MAKFRYPLALFFLMSECFMIDWTSLASDFLSFFECSKVLAKSIFHRLMGPRHHSLDAIDSLSLYKVTFFVNFNLVVGICRFDYFSRVAGTIDILTI